MNWKSSILIVIVLFLFSCKEDTKNETFSLDKELKTEATTYVNTDHLIEANELRELAAHPDIKIVHFEGEKQYQEGHIEGAVNRWHADTEDASYPYKGMMCSKSQLEELLSSKGIKNDDTIVIYDHVASCDAARLCWLLDN